MADKTPVDLNVGEGHRFHLEHYREQAPNGSFGESKYALFDDNAPGKPAVVFSKDQHLKLTGSGKNTLIRIPGNIGLEEDDPPPGIIIGTDDRKGVVIHGPHRLVDQEATRKDQSAGTMMEQSGPSQNEINAAVGRGIAPHVAYEAIRAVKGNDALLGVRLDGGHHDLDTAQSPPKVNSQPRNHSEPSR